MFWVMWLVIKPRIGHLKRKNNHVWCGCKKTVCLFLCKPSCTEVFYPFLQKGDEGEEGVTSEGMNIIWFMLLKSWGQVLLFLCLKKLTLIKDALNWTIAESKDIYNVKKYFYLNFLFTDESGFHHGFHKIYLTVIKQQISLLKWFLYDYTTLKFSFDITGNTF